MQQKLMIAFLTFVIFSMKIEQSVDSVVTLYVILEWYATFVEGYHMLWEFKGELMDSQTAIKL